MEPPAIFASQKQSGARPDTRVFSYDISLNRTGPNTMELPGVPVIAVAGSPLILEFTNYGKALHLTVSSANIAEYSGFSHENLFIEYRENLTIPIRPEAPTGEFTLDIITGYGSRKESFRVTVQDAASLPVGEPGPGYYTGLRSLRITRGPILIGIGILLYAAWFFFLRSDLLSACAFLALLAGALYPWYWRG